MPERFTIGATVRGIETGRIGTIVDWYMADSVARVRWNGGGPVQRIGLRNLELIAPAAPVPASGAARRFADDLAAACRRRDSRNV